MPQFCVVQEECNEIAETTNKRVWSACRILLILAEHSKSTTHEGERRERGRCLLRERGLAESVLRGVFPLEKMEVRTVSQDGDVLYILIS